jgi:hypothetical protein
MPDRLTEAVAASVRQVIVPTAEDEGSDDVSLMLTRVPALETAEIIQRLRRTDGVLQVAEAKGLDRAVEPRA